MYKQAKKQVPEDYSQVIDELSRDYEEVPGDQFYREIFPDNENTGDDYTDYSHPNAVYLYQGEGEKIHRRIMLKDTWEKDYHDFVEKNPLALCSGLTFRGKTNRLPAAQRMNAMIFDIDNVGPRELFFIFNRANGQPGTLLGWSMCMPTYIVTSGSGLHLYYIFTEPVDLYPNIKLQMKTLKYDLTNKLWSYRETSREKDIQYQGIAQGFRMVGSINSKYGTVVRAFRTGPKIPFEFFNEFAAEKAKVDLKKPFRPSQIPLTEAKHKYPEWYQRRIIEGKEADHWHIKKDLYHWWMRKVNDRSVVRKGHRYFYLMVLAVYAAKCDVSREELKKDMVKLFPIIQKIENPGDPFTMRDVQSAMEAYDKAYYCFTIDDIEHIMNIHIDRNRRNGRPQTIHMKLMSGIRDILHPDGSWRKGNGRPKGTNKAKAVYDYRTAHPDENVSQVARALKISRPTVYKWWDYQHKSPE